MMTPYPIHLARRMAGIAPFHVMELMAQARALEAKGRSIVHMEVGEPDFATADPMLAAAQKTLSGGRIGYTVATGIPELRQAIAGYYQARYGVTVPVERILVTPGASGALQLATALLIDPGDQMLMADPGYPCNRHFVRLVEGEPVGIPVGAESAYQLSADLVSRHWSERTVGVLLASPSNPTGTLVDRRTLEAILAVVGDQGGRVIMDEIYHGLVYGEHPTTALASSDEVFIVNSFSKYFGMTGWRLGWLIVPEAYIRDGEKLAQNLFISPSTLAQYAALAAFAPEAIAVFESRRKEFQARRDFLLPALKALGFGVPVKPEGAFYIYADCSRFSDDSYGFVMKVLEEAGVAITPGIDFGSHQAERHVRFAYTNSLENLAEGVARLGRLLK